MLKEFFEARVEACSNPERRELLRSMKVKFAVKPFGSSMFGAVDKNSDIDLLVISYGNLLAREEFSYDFVAYLKSQSAVSNVHSVPHAKIPIIKLDFKGTQLDILYCAFILPGSQIVGNLASEEAYLNDINNATYDKANNLSYMGWKTCQTLLGLINEREVFTWSLRIIK
jgi:poly(A) polymerase